MERHSGGLDSSPTVTTYRHRLGKIILRHETKVGSPTYDFVKKFESNLLKKIFLIASTKKQIKAIKEEEEQVIVQILTRSKNDLVQIFNFWEVEIPPYPKDKITKEEFEYFVGWIVKSAAGQFSLNKKSSLSELIIDKFSKHDPQDEKKKITLATKGLCRFVWELRAEVYEKCSFQNAFTYPEVMEIALFDYLARKKEKFISKFKQKKDTGSKTFSMFCRKMVMALVKFIFNNFELFPEKFQKAFRQTLLLNISAFQKVPFWKLEK